MEIKIDEKLHEMFYSIWKDVTRDIETNSRRLHQIEYPMKYFIYKKSDIEPSGFERLFSSGNSEEESACEYLVVKIFGKITDERMVMIMKYLLKKFGYFFLKSLINLVAIPENQKTLSTDKQIELGIEKLQDLIRQYLKNYEAIMKEEKADIKKYNDFQIAEEMVRQEKQERIDANLSDITAAIRRFNQENMKNEKE